MVLVQVISISAHLTSFNESTAGADASVEVPKLHDIKLFIHTLYHDEHFLLHVAEIQSPGITGKLKEWVIFDDDYC